MAKLLVFDVYGTLLTDSHRRGGVVEFLDKNPEARSTIFTDVPATEMNGIIKDTERTYILRILNEMKIEERLTEPYFFGESMREGYKDLAAVAREFCVDISDIVMIGDSDGDSLSAYHHGAKVIRIEGLPKRDSERLITLDQIGNVREFLGDHQAAVIETWNGKVEIYKGTYQEMGLDK